MLVGAGTWSRLQRIGEVRWFVWRPHSSPRFESDDLGMDICDERSFGDSGRSPKVIDWRL